MERKRWVSERSRSPTEEVVGGKGGDIGRKSGGVNPGTYQYGFTKARGVSIQIFEEVEEPT